MLRAIGNKVILEAIPEPEADPNAIIIPDSAKVKESTIKATVASIGSLVKELKVGETVLLANWAKPTEIESKVFYIVSEEEVIAVLEV